MDPLTTLSLASNILQIVDLAGRLVSTVKKLSRSPDGALAEHRETEITSAGLLTSMNRLMSSEIANDETLKKISESVCTLAQELLTTLGTVKADGEGPKWRVIKIALRSVWREGDMTKMQARLAHLRLQLIAHISVCLVHKYGSIEDALVLMAEKMERIDSKLEVLRTLLGSGETRQPTENPGLWTAQGHPKETPNNDLTNNEKTEPGLEDVTESQQPLVADHSTLQPVRVSSLSDRTLSCINPPIRSSCGRAACACACHLDRYYKTPLFFRKLVGSITFKGVCRDHPAKSSELKYWLPDWISNYNIYLWFEQNVSGTPSFGLKLQRKVSWGSQDTIIRFSFVGDTEGIKAVLKSGVGSLDDVDPNHGRTPLHYAVQKNHVQACQFLVQVGADMFVEDESGMSAIQRAWEQIFTNQGPPMVLDTFKTLFPNVDLECWQFSPLHKAVLGIEGFSLAEQLKTDVCFDVINAADARGRTALHWGALRGDLNAVEILLDAAADVHVVDAFKCTPLLYAASSATPRMVELLILRKADVNFANNAGDSPLHPLHYGARHEDDVTSVKVLVQAGAQVDRKNFVGNTPFAGTAIINRLSSGTFLLQSGADRYSTNKYGDTPLRQTIHHNSHEFLHMLLKAGTKYDDINRSGSTILHALALEGDTETARILKAFNVTGLDTQMRNAEGKTAMDFFQERISAPKGFKEEFLELLASLDPLS